MVVATGAGVTKKPVPRQIECERCGIYKNLFAPCQNCALPSDTETYAVIADVLGRTFTKIETDDEMQRITVRRGSRVYVLDVKETRERG